MLKWWDNIKIWKLNDSIRVSYHHEARADVHCPHWMILCVGADPGVCEQWRCCTSQLLLVYLSNLFCFLWQWAGSGSDDDDVVWKQGENASLMSWVERSRCLWSLFNHGTSCQCQSMSCSIYTSSVGQQLVLKEALVYSRPTWLFTLFSQAQAVAAQLHVASMITFFRLEVDEALGDCGLCH